MQNYNNNNINNDWYDNQFNTNRNIYGNITNQCNCAIMYAQCNNWGTDRVINAFVRADEYNRNSNDINTHFNFDSIYDDTWGYELIRCNIDY